MVLDMVWIWFPCERSDPVPTPSACSTCSTNELPRMDLPTPDARFITFAIAPSSNPPLFHRRKVSSPTGTALARALRLIAGPTFVDGGGLGAPALDAFARAAPPELDFLTPALELGSNLSVFRIESKPRKPPRESRAFKGVDAFEPDPRLAPLEGLDPPPFLTFNAARPEDAPNEPLTLPLASSPPEAAGDGVPGASSLAGGRSSALVSK
mmetsp:Transcript_963/g.4331  ORF Transcript_963/g.4331 Transcript_963/m.4331 type:complete len:210 (+) Transcript_963:286-915(+)